MSEEPSITPLNEAGEALPHGEALVHLHVHSEYSLADGALKIKELIKRVKAMGHKAVALTDHGNLFGAVEFYTEAKNAGLKAIIGSEIYHTGSEKTRAYAKEQNHVPPQIGAFHLTLLAKSNDGYKNLIKVVSAGHMPGMRDESLRDVPVSLEGPLDDYSGGLIALSSCVRGEFGYLVRELRRHSGAGPLTFEAEDGPAQEVYRALQAHVASMRRRFGEDYYVELIDNGLPEQKRVLPDLVTVARHFGLPLVATADAHYGGADFAEAHVVLTAIKNSITMSRLRKRRRNARFHLLSNEEMLATYGAWPEALFNQQKIAEACHVKMEFGVFYLPKFPLDGDETVDQALVRFAKTGLEERFIDLRKVYGPTFDAAREDVYRKRLEFELETIIKMGFPGYFLIVQDFINWAKRQDIPVGPGRGSGAGSLVAYALRITDLDPLPYNLVFERFLNPERVSMPDFDVDFCQDRREEVIRYVMERYGRTQVAQITTFGKMLAKAAVRDVGRVLEMGYSRVDKIAKLIPNELGITLEQAFEKEPRLTEEYKKDPNAQEILDLARKLEGLSRQTGVHAAGIVISDGPVMNYVPVYMSEDGGLITQYEMKNAEKVGLVKFDFLGLKTLTVIHRAVRLVHRTAQPALDIATIDLEDKKVYQDISAGHTTSIFQLESDGMRQLLLKLQPNKFEDLVAVVALFRPGPLGSGMVDDFIERKHGRQEIDYMIPGLEEVLADTYGIILYQEQVQKIAAKLANYTLGEADLLRRAMGKKKPEEMAKQKSRFVSGCVANQIDEGKASELFDLMAKFAEYGFNKSHSAAYGLVSYQTAYLKSHFPAQFMAAIMTCDTDNTEKIVRYVDEVRRMKIKLLALDINTSRIEFDVPAPNVISFGLGAIKGIGTSSLEPLLKEREQNGPFSDLDDLARRVDLRAVGKKTLELLVQAGAFDGFGLTRPELLAKIDALVKLSEFHLGARSSGQRLLFDEAPAPTPIKAPTAPLPRPLQPNNEWLFKERKLLGVYLTAHPLDRYAEDLRCFGRVRIKDFDQYVNQDVGVVAMLSEVSDRLTKAGKRLAFAKLEDQDAAIEGLLADTEMLASLPPVDTPVMAFGRVTRSFDETSLRFKIQRIMTLEDVRRDRVRGVCIHVKAVTKETPNRNVLDQLRQLFAASPGKTAVKFSLDFGNASLVIDASTHQVSLSESLLRGLGALSLPETHLSYYV